MILQASPLCLTASFSRMTSSANSPLEDLEGLRTHVFVPGLTQIIFAELIRGSPIYL